MSGPRKPDLLDLPDSDPYKRIQTLVCLDHVRPNKSKINDNRYIFYKIAKVESIDQVRGGLTAPVTEEAIEVINDDDIYD